MHTPAQLQEWDAGWWARYESAFPNPHPGELADLFDERADWLERHPCSKVVGTWTASCDHRRASSVKWDGTVEQWRPLVEKHFGHLTPTAMCLIHHESRGNPNALSPAGARGLLQVMPFWAHHYGIPPDQLYDPDTNLRTARLVYQAQGWRAWNPYKRGLCRGLS